MEDFDLELAAKIEKLNLPEDKQKEITDIVFWAMEKVAEKNKAKAQWTFYDTYLRGLFHQIYQILEMWVNQYARYVDIIVLEMVAMAA